MSDPQSGVGVANGDTPVTNGPTTDSDRPWMRPWNPSEIRQNCTEWSLAADSGLLKYLQEFSTKFMAKAHEATLAVNDLMHETSMTDATMRNVADRFLTLSDSQFIENRVYDEDVSEDAKENPGDDKEDGQTEVDPFPNLKEAIQNGLKVLDDAFDVLDANAANSDYDSELDSDAEGEANGMQARIYEPKDPYVNRPLPFLIGSRNFHETEDLGIKDLPSGDEEAQDDHGSISESDEDIEKPCADRKDSLSSSDYESESDYSDSEEEKLNRGGSVKKEKRTSFSSESDEENNLFENKSEDDFSDDDKSPLPQRKSNKDKKTSLKIKKKNTKPKEEDVDLFADDEDGDDLFANTGQGLFGAGANLFDKKKKQGGGLFDDVDVSEEESGKAYEEEENDDKSQKLSSEEEETGLGGEEKVQEKSSKPHGGVSLFSGAINKELLSKTRRESDATKSDSASQASGQSSKKASNLFLDDEEDDNDLFSSKTQSKEKSTTLRKPKSSSLFSDSAEEEPTPIAEKPPTRLKKKSDPPKPKAAALFSDSADEGPPPLDTKASKVKKKKPASDLFGSDSDDGLFGSTAPQKAATKKPEIKTKPSPSTATKKKVPSQIFASESSSEEDSMFSKKPPAMKAATESKGLFDTDSDDDFFADVKSKPTPKVSAKSKAILSEETDEDDLFSSLPASEKDKKKSDDKPKEVEKEGISKPPADSLFADDSEDYEEEEEKHEEPAPKKKPPAGAVSMFGSAFGGAELSAAISKRRSTSEVSTKSSSSNEFEEDEDGKTQKEPSKRDSRPQEAEEKAAETAKLEDKEMSSSPPKPAKKVSPIVNVTAKPFKPFGNVDTNPDPDFHPITAKSQQPVSKLRTGLSIDPSTLLPGAAPKPKPVVKTEISFDKPPVLKTLESVNKTRSRGQANRRPPSRHGKARRPVQKEIKPESKTGGGDKSPKGDPRKTVDLETERKMPEVERIDTPTVPEASIAPKTGKTLIDSPDLDDELFSGSLFGKSDKNPKSESKSKISAPKLFSDDDDFLDDFTLDKKPIKEDLKFMDDDDEDIFGDLNLDGGILSKKKTESIDGKPSATTKDTAPPSGVSSSKVVNEIKLPDDYDNIFGDISIDIKPKGTKGAKTGDDFDIFGDDLDFSVPSTKTADKPDLFDEDTPAKSSDAKEKPAKKKSLDEDDIFGDDIFSDMTAAPKAKKKKAEKKSKPPKTAPTASIFDDDEDMSDIFASTSSKKTSKGKKPASKNVEKKTEKSTASSTVMDDPLSMP